MPVTTEARSFRESSANNPVTGTSLHLSVVDTRQQVARAQWRLNGDRRRQQVDCVARRRLVQAFPSAAQTGDLGHLVRVLSSDAGGRR
ncbi:hypothetical protein ABZT06_07315 [Streptomyces sp. NPDC005483]|uniref:hypothetical protein n=1 Tax=Streptomyces sp. NPDC005483 TaxID=3154882 RepID=UPI00339F2DD0